MSGYSAYEQGQAQEKQGKYQAAVDRNNAMITDWQAQDEIDRGKEEERRARAQAEIFKGRQMSALASSGNVIDYGSSLDILSETAETSELDALTVRSNAERRAYGYKTQSTNYRASASANSMAASSASKGKYIRAGSSLLSGASQTSYQYHSMTN